MAKTGKRRGVNKSQEIRKAYEKLGDSAKPKDVIAKLATRNIKVSPGLVANVRHSMLKKAGKKPSGRGGGKRAADNDTISVTALVDAKRLIEHAGSINDAKKALDTLAKLGA